LWQGCVYELQTMRDPVPIDCLVFLIDATTDRVAPKAALTERWQALSAS
jgi:hypothetical protein